VTWAKFSQVTRTRNLVGSPEPPARQSVVSSPTQGEQVLSSSAMVTVSEAGLPRVAPPVGADKVAEKFPLIMTSGRLVEYEGGGDETRSNPWLAELQQDCYVEVNPKVAADRGVRNGEFVWVSTPSGARLKVKAKVTEGVGPDTCFIPFHFAGWWQGKDLLPYYPEGAAPIVRGEAVNTATTYGYDRVTMMQETKTTLCQLERA
jgi:formate dehydrogenase major subunit